MKRGMIRAVEIVAPGQVQWVERAAEAVNGDAVRSAKLSTPSKGGVRLRVDAVGICGSDVALVAGRHPYATYPITPGHEIAATVLEVPESVNLETGQRVAVCPLLTCGRCAACDTGRPNHCPEVRVLGVHVNGGMAEEITLPVEMLRAVPDSLASADAEATAMVEPTAVAVHGCRRAGLGEGGLPASRLPLAGATAGATAGIGASIAIIGTGVIGMLALQVARAWGAGPILAVDRVRSRLRMAEDLGADAVADNASDKPSSAVEAGRELCPDGFDVVLDLVGHAATLTDAMALARPGGTIVLVALPHGQAQGAAHGAGFFDFEVLYRKELTLRATRLYDADFDAAIPLLASGRVDPLPLITHRIPMKDADRAFVLAAEHPDEAIKVIVNP